MLLCSENQYSRSSKSLPCGKFGSRAFRRVETPPWTESCVCVCVILRFNESLNVAARVQSVKLIICSRGLCPQSLDAPHITWHMMYSGHKLSVFVRDGAPTSASQFNRLLTEWRLLCLRLRNGLPGTWKYIFLPECVNLEVEWPQPAFVCVSVQPCGRLFQPDEQCHPYSRRVLEINSREMSGRVRAPVETNVCLSQERNPNFHSSSSLV